MNLWSLSPFSDSYLIFLNFIKCILSLKNRKKWGFIHKTTGLMWRAGAHRAAWRGMRDPRGCDAAHKATWQGRASPREAQVVHRAWTRGRRPRGSTRTPVRGATWQGRAGVWRAHELVGPGESIGAVTQMRYRALPFLLANFPIFLRVGLCLV